MQWKDPITAGAFHFVDLAVLLDDRVLHMYSSVPQCACHDVRHRRTIWSGSKRRLLAWFCSQMSASNDLLGFLTLVSYIAMHFTVLTP